MFIAPAGRLTDWFRELLGIEEMEKEVVEEWVSERTVDEVVETLVETGIPVAPVQDLDQVMRNEQALHRGSTTPLSARQPSRASPSSSPRPRPE